MNITKICKEADKLLDQLDETEKLLINLSKKIQSNLIEEYTKIFIELQEKRKLDEFTIKTYLKLYMKDIKNALI